MLARRPATGYEVTLVCAFATGLLLPPAIFLPLMESTIKNLVFQESRLVSSVGVIYSQVWFPFAFGFLFFAFLFPALRALLQFLVLGSIRFGWRVPQAGRLFRWSEDLRIWSLTDVVVIAGVVAYVRANISADVMVGLGAWCYVAVAILSLAGERALDRRLVWNAIYPDPIDRPPGEIASCDVCELTVGGPAETRSASCPRCGAQLDRPVVPNFVFSIAAVAAAVPLALPAYGAAFMINEQLTGVLEHTVLGTVQLLADRGYWQFGVIILIAGLGIPVVEIIGLTWLLARTGFPTQRGLVLRTRIYRVLHRLVRWPMIIPFIAAVASPIVKFRGIDDIVAGPGATPLFAIIALMMFAIRVFEPRFMWRTASE